MSTYRSNTYRMHSLGFNRQAACRGQFNSGVEVDEVDSDDGIDYVDWDALKAHGYPRGVEYTYRIIDGATVHFRNGEEV
jgi:hypothetical protein